MIEGKAEQNQTNSRFLVKDVIFKGIWPFSRGVIFTSTYLFRSLYYPWKKKLQCDCQEKKYTFFIRPEPT